MKNIGNFLSRLTSRKFLLTVTGLVLVTLFPDARNEIVALIATFVGAEGAADAVSRYSVSKAAFNEASIHDQQRIASAAFAELDAEEDEVDITEIRPGQYPL